MSPISTAMRAFGVLALVLVALAPAQHQPGRVIHLGAGCGADQSSSIQPDIPVLTATTPVIGKPIRIAIQSDLGPNVPVTVAASFDDAGTFENGGTATSCSGSSGLDPKYFTDTDCGCTVFTDICDLSENGLGGASNWIVLLDGFTNSEGDVSFSFQLDDTALIGRQLNIQARLCGVVNGLTGCFQGIDYLSNGVGLVIGERERRCEGRPVSFWKSRQVRNCWTRVNPHTSFDRVFDDAFPHKNLLQVLKNRGHSELDALGRETVAALLNALERGIDYPLTAREVVRLFNAAVPGTAADQGALASYLRSKNCKNRGHISYCRSRCGGRSYSRIWRYRVNIW